MPNKSIKRDRRGWVCFNRPLSAGGPLFQVLGPQATRIRVQSRNNAIGFAQAFCFPARFSHPRFSAFWLSAACAGQFPAAHAEPARTDGELPSSRLRRQNRSELSLSHPPPATRGLTTHCSGPPGVDLFQTNIWAGGPLNSGVRPLRSYGSRFRHRLALASHRHFVPVPLRHHA